MWEDDDLDRMLSESMGLQEHSLRTLNSGQPLSTVEVGDRFVTVVFDLPGAERDEVTVTCTDEKVTVVTEVTRRVKGRGGSVGESYARYSKEITLPVRVVPDKGTAKFKNGMITVRLPIREERRLPKEGGKRLKLTK